MKKQSMVATTLICPRCNNRQIIYRKTRKQKSFGHLKWLWCYKCKRITNHFEICNEEVEEIEDEDRNTNEAS